MLSDSEREAEMDRYLEEMERLENLLEANPNLSRQVRAKVIERIEWLRDAHLRLIVF